MLAKIWKKVLFAICIIACLFNVTAKLVNRHSLKENLQSVNDGITILDILKKETTDKLDINQMEVIEKDSNQQNKNIIKEDEKSNSKVIVPENYVEDSSKDNINTESNENIENQENINNDMEIGQDESGDSEESRTKFSDYTIFLNKLLHQE